MTSFCYCVSLLCAYASLYLFLFRFSPAVRRSVWLEATLCNPRLLLVLQGQFLNVDNDAQVLSFNGKNVRVDLNCAHILNVHMMQLPE